MLNEGKKTKYSRSCDNVKACVRKYAKKMLGW